MNSGILKCSLTRHVIKKNAGKYVLFCTGEPSGGCRAGRMESLAKKLREKTPIGKLDELEEGKHPYQEKEPLSPFPGGVNPETGEVGGPRGPEPTRFGDWERKGRVSDF